MNYLTSLRIKSKKEIIAWLTTYLFLIISTLLIVKPVSQSYFIRDVGVEKLPYLYIMVAAVAAVFTFLYQKVNQNRLIFSSINISMLIHFAVLGFLGWKMYHHDVDMVLIYAFCIWVSIFGVLSTMQFWLMANYFFTTTQAKKVFGILGAGGVAGGMFGGFFTNLVADSVGHTVLLMICGSFLFIALLINNYLKFGSREVQGGLEKSSTIQKFRKEEKLNVWGEIKESPYLKWMILLVFCSVIVSKVIDYQFSDFAEKSIDNKEELTGFIAFCLSLGSLVSLLIQLLFTKLILNRKGVISSLHILPNIILLFSTLLFLFPTLIFSFLLRTSELSIKQSVHKAGFELLFLPISKKQKERFKVFIDVFIDNLANGVSGVLLLILVNAEIMNWNTGFAIVIALAIIWLMIIQKLRKEYLAVYGKAIEKENVDLEEFSGLSSSQKKHYLQLAIDSGEVRKVSYMLDVLGDNIHQDMVPIIKQVLAFRDPQILEKTFQKLMNNNLQGFEEECSKILNEHRDNPFLSFVSKAYLIQTGEISSEEVIGYKEHDDTVDRILYVHHLCQYKKSQKEERSIYEYIIQLQTHIRSAADDKRTRYYALLGGIIIRNELEQAEKVLIEIFKLIDADYQNRLLNLIAQTNRSTSIPLLIHALHFPKIRQVATKTIANLGEIAMPSLKRFYHQKALGRKYIPSVLSEIGTQESMEFLLTELEVESLEVRHFLIRAVYDLFFNHAHISVDKKRLNAVVLMEIKNSIGMYKALRLVEAGRSDWNVKTEFLEKSIQGALEHGIKIVFLELAVYYKETNILSALKRYLSNNQKMKANAIEFMENILNREHKRELIPLLSLNESERLPLTYKNIFPSNRAEVMEFLLDQKDDWLMVNALYFNAQNEGKFIEPEIIQMMSDTNSEIVLETLKNYYPGLV